MLRMLTSLKCNLKSAHWNFFRCCIVLSFLGEHTYQSRKFLITSDIHYQLYGTNTKLLFRIKLDLLRCVICCTSHIFVMIYAFNATGFFLYTLKPLENLSHAVHLYLKYQKLKGQTTTLLMMKLNI